MLCQLLHRMGHIEAPTAHYLFWIGYGELAFELWDSFMYKPSNGLGAAVHIDQQLLPETLEQTPSFHDK